MNNEGIFKNLNEELIDFINKNSEKVCPKGKYDNAVTCSQVELIRFINPIIEENKEVKRAYADFVNQILKADSSQTIQGLQITIRASRENKR